MTNSCYTFGFMAHIEHKHIDYVEQTLLEYPEVTTYLIGMEQTDYEHMHFVVHATKDTWYRNFSKRVFIDKFKLRGKATKGKPRQYGKIGKIKDQYKLKCYTVKDKNIRTNMDQKEIDDYLENSTKKVELEGYYTQLLAKIDVFHEKWLSDRNEYTKQEYYKNLDTIQKSSDFDKWNFDLDTQIKIFIISEFKKNNLESITKGKIEAVWNRWSSKNLSPSEIYYYIYRKRG